MENLCSKELTTKLWVFISLLQKSVTQSKTRNTELIIESKN